MADAEELRQAAHRAVLTGLPAGKSLSQIEAEVGRSNVRGVYTPDIAMFEIVVAALEPTAGSASRCGLTRRELQS